MKERIDINGNADSLVANQMKENRANERQSQTITYDATAMQALILSACGLKPIPGTKEADHWRVQSDRIMHGELDRLRAASGMSAAQTISFKPIDETGV